MVELGRIGIWSGELRRLDEHAACESAAELERLGYGALWIPGRGAGVFERVRALLGTTQKITVATGILSIWDIPAAEVAAGYHALEQDFPGRFLLGLGVSHGREKTYDAFVAFLDGLDQAATPVPANRRVLAALGPRMLKLARDRSAGTHPYNVPVSYIGHAREALGTDALIAAEQAVILDSDPTSARAKARQFLDFYLKAPNYTNNLQREGLDASDLQNGGSDRLIDAIIAWGDNAAIRERINALFAAGANHVCVQAIGANRDAFPTAEWSALASALIV